MLPLLPAPLLFGHGVGFVAIGIVAVVAVVVVGMSWAGNTIIFQPEPHFSHHDDRGPIDSGSDAEPCSDKRGPKSRYQPSSAKDGGPGRGTNPRVCADVSVADRRRYSDHRTSLASSQPEGAYDVTTTREKERESITLG